MPAVSTNINSLLTSFTRPLSRLQQLRRQFSSAAKMSTSFKVAKTSDLKDGQMKEVEIPGTEGKVLLSRVKGQYYATGNRCTRTDLLGIVVTIDYGAPLKNGVLTSSGRLVCPWHGIIVVADEG